MPKFRLPPAICNLLGIFWFGFSSYSVTQTISHSLSLSLSPRLLLLSPYFPATYILSPNVTSLRYLGVSNKRLNCYHINYENVTIVFLSRLFSKKEIIYKFVQPVTKLEVRMCITHRQRFPNTQFQAFFKLVIAHLFFYILFNKGIHWQSLPLVSPRGKKINLMAGQISLPLPEWLWGPMSFFWHAWECESTLCYRLFLQREFTNCFQG